MNGYTHRKTVRFHDDTKKSYVSANWQRRVYELAREYADSKKFKKILDIGTGSGYKLIKYFNNFETLGIDLLPTVDWLKKKYSDREWSDRFEPVLGFDLIISSDVIEHVSNPDNLLDLIEKSKPKLIVLSTPDRNLLNKGQDGPPKNTAHFREWSFQEFRNYIESRFNIIEHLITHEKQATQTIVCELRK